MNIKLNNRLSRFSAALFFVSLFSAVASAQVTWMKSYDNHGGAVEFAKGVGKAFDDDDLTGYALFFHGHIRFTPKLIGLVQVPVCHSHITEDLSWLFGDDRSRTVIGNPYFGIERAKQNQSSSVLQAGVRLPIASDEGFQNGIATSFGGVIAYQQFEAFYPKMFTAQAAYGYQLFSSLSDNSTFVWKTVFGGSFMKPQDVDPELFLDLNTSLWSNTEYIRVGGGGIARMHVTEDYDSFGDRFSIQAAMGLMGVFGQVRPQVNLQFPLTNDMADIMDFTFWLSLGVDFGGSLSNNK